MNGEMNQQIKEEQAMERENTRLDRALYSTNYRPLTHPLLQCSRFPERVIFFCKPKVKST